MRIDDSPAWIGLYREAQRADKEFQAELMRLYGSRAGDMRYRPLETDTLRVLGREHEAAAEALRVFVNLARRTGDACACLVENTSHLPECPTLSEPRQ